MRRWNGVGVEKLRSVLKFFPGDTDEERLLAMARSALRERLRNVSLRLSELEAKYAMTFEEFVKAWEEGKIPGKWSFEVEQDYFDWEALVSERERLLSLLREVQKG